MSGADELFEVPPSQFVAARDALARQLKEDDPDEAKRIAKLRRPPGSVWALNVLARHQPELITGVLAAGTALRQALAKASVDRPAWNDARAAERDAVDAALEAAGQVLGGANDADRRRMAETLRAAIVDADVADHLARGVLTEDAMTTGLGTEGVSFARATRPGKQDPVEAKRERGRRARRAELEAEADRLRRHADRLRADALRAVRAADEAGREADRAEAEAAAAAGRLAHDAMSGEDATG